MLHEHAPMGTRKDLEVAYVSHCSDCPFSCRYATHPYSPFPTSLQGGTGSTGGSAKRAILQEELDELDEFLVMGVDWGGSMC